jgi:hypothetical protein
MMYSKADVIEMFEKLKDLVSTNMENELAYYINMNCKLLYNIGIYVQLLFHDADSQKVGLKVETSQVQNL